ncbi:MAG: hypothetical protein FWC00_04965 [Firmicutes bacterium]|nr:hypothetical protein [Bacillota bacterium]
MSEDILDELLEQPAEVPQAPVVDESQDCASDNTDADSKENILGRFKNVDELAKAYDNLVKEFTRKSQELSLLKDSKNSEVRAESKAGDGDTPQPPSPSREDIIKEYLTSFQTQPAAPTVIMGVDDFALGKKPEAKSLREVTKIAEEYFRTKILPN